MQEMQQLLLKNAYRGNINVQSVEKAHVMSYHDEE